VNNDGSLTPAGHLLQLLDTFYGAYQAARPELTRDQLLTLYRRLDRYIWQIDDDISSVEEALYDGLPAAPREPQTPPRT